MNEAITYSDAQNFESDVLKSKVPVAVYFYSEDCPRCSAFNPIFDRLAEVSAHSMKFVRVFRQHNRELAERYNVRSSPAVMFFKDGSETCPRLYGYISKPELRVSVEKVIGGTCRRGERRKVYCDVLILGGGPAGLSAAIYAARAKMSVIVVDEGMPGGQVSTTYQVANYPGTNGVIRGVDLMDNMKKQALDFGAQIDDMKEISEVNLDTEEKFVKSEDTDYLPKCVIIATGAEPRKLPAEGEREYRGRGVHYCATCDGALYQDTDVLVAGGGNSAVEGAVFLTRYAKHITIIHQLDHFQASKAAQDEALKNTAISVLWSTEVRKLQGDNFLKSVVVEDLKTREMKEIKADGIFVYIGMQPKTDLFKDRIKLNEQGYIITDGNMRTNLAGVFAAGDVREKDVRQIATAASDGVIAGIMVERFVNGKL